MDTSHSPRRKPAGRSRTGAFDLVALVLQGGGALGSYQAGVCEALAEAGIHPDWVAGISIGAVNGALIAGNPPERRIERLREFWETVSAPPLGPFGVPYNPAMTIPGDGLHQWINQLRALGIALFGAPGFFRPRVPPALPWPVNQPGDLSYYDVGPLVETLGRLVDFDRINGGDTRLTVGAVNIRSGNFVHFDSAQQKLDVRHIVASGSLPPGFPPTEIDGEHYWDGGIVSNTPLQWVLDDGELEDTLAFQVDLWSARGDLPRSLVEAEVRRKEIQYSSRTRDATGQVMRAQRLRRAFRHIYEQLPKEAQESPEGRLLAEQSDDAVYNLVHLIYRSKSYEGTAKDYEFSRRTMEEHWAAGREAALRAIAHDEIFRRPTNAEGFRVFDFSGHS